MIDAEGVMPNMNERLELLQKKINDAKLHLAEAMGALRVELEVIKTLLERQRTEFSEFSSQAKRARQSVANRSNNRRPGQSDPHQTMSGLETTGKVQHG
jgi:hypothetical protein